MIYLVKPPKNSICAEINLPASKSISNRVLLLNALSGKKVRIENLSDCDDTRVMSAGLENLPEIIDVGAAGTSMRFLTAYLAQLDGQIHVLTGSERMKQRPIGVLVDALRELGADIEYMEKSGFPPLKIRGRKLKCTESLSIDGSVSSQFISALLMIGPMLETGLKIELEHEIASRSYINMTVSLMRQFGAEVAWHGSSSIRVSPVPYHPAFTEYKVEPDWSAAAFWFEIAVVGREMGYTSRISLPDLKTNSVQGDCVVDKLFENLFDCSLEEMQDLSLMRLLDQSSTFDLEFTDFPDLAQALVVTHCLVDKPFLFTGLESLHIKETDRIQALKTELAKLGIALRGGEGKDEQGTLMWQRGFCKKKFRPVIQTYKDHRMAMAFAPCCLCLGEIRIADPGVVSKSYPGFWDDLKKAGFTIEEIA